MISRCAVLALILLVMPARAEAANMPHFDLRSLFMSSELVIKAQKVSVRWIDSYQRATTFRVLHAYKGPLRVGDTIEINGPSSYAFEGMGEASAKQPIPEMLFLFLSKTGAQVPGMPEWHITLSGVRMLTGGRAQRFEQASNPGPFVPVPHRRDPFDLLGLPGAGEPLSERELHADFERAKLEANIVERALLESDPVKARVALLPLIGPSVGERRHAAVPPMFSQFRDVVAGSVVRRLARLGDLDGVLEAWSRIWGGDPRVSWPASFDEARFIGAAEDTSRVEHQRIAALEIVRARAGLGPPTNTPRLVALLGDASPQLRAQVVRALQNRVPVADVADALVSAWEKEQSPEVQHALLVAAAQRDLIARFQSKGRPDLVVTAHADHDVVDIGYAALPPARWGLTQASVAVKQNGAAPQVLDLVSSAAPNAWGSGHHGGARVRMDPKPPLPPGTYTLSLSVGLTEGSGQQHEVELELGLWVIPEAPLPPAPTPEPMAQDPAPLEVLSQFPPPQHGCACRAGGRERFSGWWILGTGALALRRRRRGCARAPNAVQGGL